MAYSLRTIRFFLLAMFLVCKSSLPAHAVPEATPAPMFETDPAQLDLLQARCDLRDQKILCFAAALGILSVFGLICAFWAYRDCRNVYLWFTIGFALNFLAFILIFIVRRRNRGRKRYRRFVSYWYASR